MSVIIQPAGSAASRIHYQDTVANPVELERFRELLGSDYESLNALYPQGRAAMWGVTPGKREVNVSKYKKISRGDLVVFMREGKLFASAEVTHLFRNPELARALWGETDAGETWEYMYALTSPKAHDLDYADLRQAINSKPGDNFMGFRVIEGVKGIRVYDLLEEHSPFEDWDMLPGTIVKRTLLHDRFGGARFGGIEPSAQTPNIFLFTSDQGREFGYDYDGYQEDGSYFYTGDGQVGDQLPNEGGNKALLESISTGRSLRLFESMARDGLVRYIGEFTLDSPAFHLAKAPDRNGAIRTVLVFHLQPVGIGLLSQEQSSIRESFELGSSEQSHVTQFQRKAFSRDSISIRREIQLQQKFERWLQVKGITVSSARIVVSDSPSPLKPDLVLPDLRIVIEAKSSLSRGHIRQAVGQVLDYRYNMERLSPGDYWTPAILLPGMPGENLKNVVLKIGIGIIYPYKGDFKSLGLDLGLKTE